MILLHEIELSYNAVKGASSKPLHHILVNENLIQYIEPTPYGSKIVMTYGDEWNPMRLYVSESTDEIFRLIKGVEL